MKRIVFILILLALNLTAASVVSYNFNPTQNSTQNTQQEKPGIIYANSIVLEIRTAPYHVLCRYSENKGEAFDDIMTGSFEDKLETIHKKTLTNLQTKMHKYFIKCRDINDLTNTSSGTIELEAIFTTSNPISAQIVLEKEELTSGKYELNLITSKIPASVPKLKYSYDGIIYNPVVLNGAGTNWKGYLIIPTSVGEKVGSFKFQATDLEGKPGTAIIGKSIFIVDTISPATISSIEAISQQKKIELKWTIPDKEKIEEINIYKSSTPGVGYNDFYKNLDSTKKDYTDFDVTKGKTYYYKIATKDKAGNVASLSREVSAISSSKTTSTSVSGLDLKLHGLVDAELTEIDLLESDIATSKIMLNNFQNQEDIKTMGLLKSLQSSKSELAAIRKEVQNYKLQDLTEASLKSRIASSRIKINIIKKKTPESLTLLDTTQKTFTPTEESLRTAIVEHSSEISPSLIDKSIKKSQTLIKENNVKIKSYQTVIEILFLDGTRKHQTIIKHILESTLKKSENKMIILKIPTSISSETLKIKNTNYAEQGTGLIVFEADTKEITYTIDKKLESSQLETINIAPVEIAQQSTLMTGYFLTELPNPGSWGITILIILAISLVLYLTKIKKYTPENETVTSFLQKAHEIKQLQQNGETEKANYLYDSLKVEYATLSKKEKTQVFEQVKNISTQK